MDKESKELLHEGIVVVAALIIYETSGFLGRKTATYLNKKSIKKILYNGNQNLEDSYNKYVIDTLGYPECFLCIKKHLDKYSDERIANIYGALKLFKNEVLNKK